MLFSSQGRLDGEGSSQDGDDDAPAEGDVCVSISGVAAGLDDVVFLEALWDRVAYQHFLETHDSKSFYSIKDPSSELYKDFFTPLNAGHAEGPATNVDAIVAELTGGGELPPCSEDELKRRPSGQSS